MQNCPFLYETAQVMKLCTASNWNECFFRKLKQQIDFFKQSVILSALLSQMERKLEVFHSDCRDMCQGNLYLTWLDMNKTSFCRFLARSKQPKINKWTKKKEKRSLVGILFIINFENTKIEKVEIIFYFILYYIIATFLPELGTKVTYNDKEALLMRHLMSLECWGIFVFIPFKLNPVYCNSVFGKTYHL